MIRARSWLVYTGACIPIVAVALVALHLGDDTGGNESAPRKIPPVAQTFGAVGVTLDDPPEGTRPAVSAAEAIKAAGADGIRIDAQETIEPTASLEFYEKQLGSGLPGSVTQLVWDVLFPDAPQVVHGPSGTERDETALPCDLHVIVDATTGAVIEGFQSGCTVVPN